ncbi:hypothetical protein BEI_3627 [Halomonas beimenensis]|uniref:Uncharacterized protein n=1 Tax=Halomonas beimenensis TaxID=475662 RepID=A0A291PCH9_9GAMM|nr:hypothetical protein BEI_3627 [Halomonas beimenensis]
MAGHGLTPRVVMAAGGPGRPEGIGASGRDLNARRSSLDRHRTGHARAVRGHLARPSVPWTTGPVAEGPRSASAGGGFDKGGA